MTSVPPGVLELNVHYTTVRDWVKEYKKKKDEAFPGSGHSSASDAQIMKVLKENADLKEVPKSLDKQGGITLSDRPPSLKKNRNILESECLKFDRHFGAILALSAIAI